MGPEREVWHCIREELASHLRCIWWILPGFGRSRGMARCRWMRWRSRFWTLRRKRAIWLGWSLGGLVASQIALPHPERVQALVTASSPCFSAQEEWPGSSLTCWRVSSSS
jgi:pimeloyl-[acyl-carrier protein] methyl ester esterase